MNQIMKDIDDNRKFEIELFWKRSLFFWSFIAALFIAYVNLESKENVTLVLIVTLAGMVISFIWTLVNRGSKLWQEHWEEKLAKESKKGDFYSLPIFQVKYKGLNKVLQSRRYSVSKLTIVLSDFVLLSWFMLLINQMINAGNKFNDFDFVIITTVFVYMLYLFFFGKTSLKKKYYKDISDKDREDQFNKSKSHK